MIASNGRHGFRWLLYCHDALGLGHIRRSLSIAQSVLGSKADLAALVVTCSPVVDALPVPPGLDYIKLPSAQKTDDRHYGPRSLRIEDAHYWSLRSRLVHETAMAYDPDVLLVDKTAGGLHDELLDLLHELRHRGHTRLILGWRDILDSPERMRAEWADGGTLEVIERLYDEIWVYGDPNVFDMRVDYALPRAIVDRVRYLGYLAPHVDRESRERARAQFAGDGCRTAVVTAGGGEGGEALLECYFEAARRGLLPSDLRSVVVTGPFLSREAGERMRGTVPDGVTLLEFVPGLADQVAAADVVVSRAGYNTVCEVLGAGTPSVLVPRILHREEQRIRARRLQRMGLAEALEPESLTPRNLAQSVRQALARGRIATNGLRVDGLRQVARRAGALLANGTWRSHAKHACA